MTGRKERIGTGDGDSPRDNHHSAEIRRPAARPAATPQTTRHRIDPTDRSRDLLDFASTRGQKILEIQPSVRDVVQTPTRVALETAAQQLDEPARGRRRERLPIGFVLEHRSQGLGGGLLGEQFRAGQHLPQDDAKRPDVGPAVDLLALGLFRAHVGRGAEDDALECGVSGQRG